MSGTGGTSATPGDADLRGAQFDGTDLRGARLRMVDLRDSWFRLVDLRGVRMRGVDLAGADLDGALDHLRIWGVEVAPLLEAELDRRHPERAVLRATEPGDLRRGWSALEAMWSATVDRVAGMPAGTQDVSVDEEWSFAQTLRHLVLATDIWLGHTILGQERPFHPLGMLFTEASGREAEFGIDADAMPSYAEVLQARAGRVAMVRDHLAAVTPDELTGMRTNPWSTGSQLSVLACLRVIFTEEWHHHRFAVRDLDAIDAGPT